MNLAWVIRRALLQSGVVRQNGTTPSYFSQVELVSAAQDCLDELVAIWRNSDQDWNLTTRASTDSAFTFEGETYTPTTSLPLTSTGRTYTLPPDFISMKRIRATTANYRGTQFIYADVDSPIFIALDNEDNLGVADLIYYDIIGRRTLRLSHPIGAAVDIEIMYEARLPKLYIYSGETGNAASVTNGSTSVTTSGGTASRFTDSALSTPAVAIFNSSGGTGHPVIISQTSTDDFVQPHRVGSTGIGGAFPITSFTNDTTLVLAANWLFDTDTSIGYMLASAPTIMETHYQLFVDYLRYYIYEKIGNTRKMQSAYAEYTAGKQQFRGDIEPRSTGMKTVEDFEIDDME